MIWRFLEVCLKKVAVCLGNFDVPPRTAGVTGAGVGPAGWPGPEIAVGTSMRALAAITNRL
jgi:hypothetical protein